MRRLFALGAALVMLGCAVPGGRELVRSGAAELTAAPVVQTPAEMRYMPVVWGKSLALSLKSGAVALADDTGTPRWAAGVRLPEFEGAFSVRIVSRLAGRYGDSAVMYPELVFLDDEFREVRRVGGSAIWRLNAPGAGGDLGGEVFINEATQVGRYLLVRDARPDPTHWREASESQTNTAPIIVPVAGFIVTIPAVPMSGSSVTSIVAAAPAGQVEISLHRYRPRKVGEN